MERPRRFPQGRRAQAKQTTPLTPAGVGATRVKILRESRESQGQGILGDMRYPLRSLSPLALLLVAAPLAAAQEVLYSIDGDSPDERFGLAVSGVGDLNSDGHDDFIVGACQDSTNGNQAGEVRVFSGVDGSLMFRVLGESSGDFFGNAVSGAGDVNADGTPDFIVGAIWDANSTGNFAGSASVFSGVDGSLIHKFEGGENDFFGTRVSGVGDVNSDGHADVVVGAVQWLVTIGKGYAEVFSGADGSVLYTLTGLAVGDQFGYYVDDVGDMDSDGIGDIAVGAWQADVAGIQSGQAFVFSGVDGTEIHRFSTQAGDALGCSVGGAGDVDNDSIPDIIVGASGADDNGNYSGAAYVYSGATGALIHSFAGRSEGDQFGNCVSGAGDVDGDGTPDLLVGGINDDYAGTDGGAATIFSGATGDVLAYLPASAGGESMGSNVQEAGDVDNDGLGDFLVGAMRAGVGDPGRAVLYAGRACAAFNYCEGLVNSTGSRADISWSGSTSHLANALTLSASGLPSNQLGLFFYGPNQIQIAFGNGLRCVGGAVFRLNPPQQISPFGDISRNVDFNAAPMSSGTGLVLPGSRWNFQFWYRDPIAGGANFNLSNGLTAPICP